MQNIVFEFVEDNLENAIQKQKKRGEYYEEIRIKVD